MQLIKLNYQLKIKHNLTFFSKDEIKSILNLYSIYVSKGIFKDYSIDNKLKFATFSFYRHTHDKPLFQIEKQIKKKNDFLPEFLIIYKTKILEKNKSLTFLIERLDKKFKILKFNK